MEGAFTLNDVILEIMTGALRAVLISRDELPNRALIANVPAATGRHPDRLFGNSVGLLFTALPVHLRDRVDRMKQIHETTHVARQANKVAGVELLDEWLEFVPPKPFALAAKWYERSRLARRRSPMMNLVASNVRGPAQAGSVAGVPIADLYSVGPLNIDVALNITVWSYAGRLNFTVLSCPAQLPEPHVLTEALQESYLGLRRALGVIEAGEG
jgi:diacylglycerol O-acyltransferase